MKETPIAQDFFAVLEAFYVCLSHSKANALFMEVQKTQRMGMQPRQLKRLIETRWASRHDSIEAVCATLTPVLTTLESMANSNDSN